MVATLRELRDECSSAVDPEYAAKYLHRIPAAPAVDRVGCLMQKCRDKRVLSLGGSGPLEERLRAVSTDHYTVDKVRQDENTLLIDLDAEPQRLLELVDKVDVVVCGEILEHLSNPGHLLDVLRQMQVPVVVTAPNAFSEAGRGWLRKSLENVNGEHVAWYSYKTLKTLLVRHGFEVVEFAWYAGCPLYAEGLIFSVR
jgi:2-polyprenyl-3-methyl-5-hydroxy-6-metoxy-1,4-benzoquinol methylase